MCKCIYCNSSENLTVSDIIPYALTGAKLTKKFVCKEHNDYTNVNFESDVINNLNVFRNKLGLHDRQRGDVKYKADLTVDGYKINNINMSSRASFFEDKKRLFKSSKDGKDVYIGNVEKLIQKNGVNSENINILDTRNMMESFKFLPEDLLASDNMLLTVAKISYEWHCSINNINEYNEDKYGNIVNCILNKGNIEDFAEIVIDINLYNLFDKISSYGTHSLFEYIDTKGNICVIFSFWNVIIYKTIVCFADIPSKNLSRQCKAYMYNIDKTTSNNFFGVYGSCDFLSMNPKDAIKQYHKIFIERLENLMKTIVLSYEKVRDLYKSLAKALDKYKESKNFAQLIDYESNDRITIIKLLEDLYNYRDNYIKEKSFNANLRNLYNENLIITEYEDKCEYISYLQKTHNDGNLAEIIESWLDNFNERIV